MEITERLLFMGLGFIVGGFVTLIVFLEGYNFSKRNQDRKY